MTEVPAKTALLSGWEDRSGRGFHRGSFYQCLRL